LFEGKDEGEREPFLLGFFVISVVENYEQERPRGRAGSVTGTIFTGFPSGRCIG
jgi:hypothetical protein